MSDHKKDVVVALAVTFGVMVLVVGFVFFLCAGMLG